VAARDWFKVDDAFAMSPKRTRCSSSAIGVWVVAGSWAAQQMTDGCVPEHMLAFLGGTPQDAAELVEAGLWEPTDGGWIFHDWADYQPSREQITAGRAAARERMRRVRESRSSEPADVVRLNHQSAADGVRANSGRSSAVVAPTPTRPDPTRRKGTSSAKDADGGREDVTRLCQLLADRIEANGSRRPAISKKWRDSARLMLDVDQRTEEQITNAIVWSQDDLFWRGNILSMPKLRERFDQLRLAAKRSGPPQTAARLESARARNIPEAMA
jgi:hypothetical protein